MNFRYRITADFLKGIRASGVLFDRIILLSQKSKLYRTIIRPAMLDGLEC